MSDKVKIMKQDLFDELDLIVRTTSGLIKKINEEEWSFRLVETMRSLQELVQHLVLIPSQDLAILQEKNEAEVTQMAKEIETVSDAEKLINIMEQGTKDLKEYMISLSDDDFLTKATKPFYSDHASTQLKWLIEIVTHAQHHRSQVFTYMKFLKHDINMFDLY
ncbi:DinB family protein [Bacillus horti]|uniref:Damage-inducible protein DinB n=1 Tax=Caldalkalibacillus horti TaxID=77523 RepID=A0ABT9VXB2_9BACI|nr:DinB family protein [Bacillus horti]MDQ0165618.1 putative damage-inducible protein DinB [Bacillus horti]